jgi:hypothetical protein
MEVRLKDQRTLYQAEDVVRPVFRFDVAFADIDSLATYHSRILSSAMLELDRLIIRCAEDALEVGDDLLL